MSPTTSSNVGEKPFAIANQASIESLPSLPTLNGSDSLSKTDDFRVFTSVQSLPVDADGKATRINVFSNGKPHMRAFHLSWLGFFIAFTAWFAYAPLLKNTVGPDLKMTASDIDNSNISNVAATVIFRFLIGPLVDKLGSATTMGALLVLGSIPLGLSVLSTNATGIVVSRLFIGVIGAVFVPCQYWTTALFSRNVVGTANALAGGWGNMGAGATSLLMPQVYNLFHGNAGLTPHLAWRVSMLVPVVLCWISAASCLRYAYKQYRDYKAGAVLYPDNPYKKLAAARAAAADASRISEIRVDDGKETDTTDGVAIETVTTVTTPTSGVSSPTILQLYLRCLTNVNVLILMLHYACCFGIELSIDGAIASFLSTTFSLDQTTAANVGATFGLMNIFSRLTGGLISDALAHRMGPRGRIGWQAFLFLVSAASLIGFSKAGTLTTAVVALCVFSYSTEAGAGATFGMVPFILPYMGSVAGLVGAGGNIGGALFNVLVKATNAHPRDGFFWMGVIVLGVGFVSCFFLKVEGTYLLWDAKPKTAVDSIEGAVNASDDGASTMASLNDIPHQNSRETLVA
ncbi:High-affinity nitrate transporter 2.1 [Irineochytrium annulatum]|nr:High-affinity nitrate transporter 2.1 [Irineochytrium annulatum]